MPKLTQQLLLSPAPGPDRLPGRVKNAIDAMQASSEILIGWIQLAVVCTFAALYALSPKP